MRYRVKQKKNFAPLLGLACVLVIVIGAGWFARGAIRDAWFNATRPSVPAAVAYKSSTSTGAVAKPVAGQPKTQAADPLAWNGPFPESVNLAVPFMLQAPLQNWVQPYEDACEEASSLMLDGFYDGRTKNFEPNEALGMIDKLVAWEDKTFGYNQHTDADDVVSILKTYFGHKRALIRDLKTADDLKKALANGYPVIVPAYGKALMNPNFKNGGPEYHMVVVKGYTKDGSWITNDPGTRRGADYVYPKQILLDAAHDYDPRDMKLGRKVMIVVIP